MRLTRLKISQSLIILIIITFITLAIIEVSGTLSKSDKKVKTKKKPKNGQITIADKNVMERGLVSADMKPGDILREHNHYCELEREVRHFKGQVLGYVTPWNSHGYDIAKLFHKKFTMISPVWLQVKPKQGRCVMAGGHDIDRAWVELVTRGGDNAMVPRVLFEGWGGHDLELLFESEESMIKCSKTIVNFIKKHNFGGLTLEMWNQMPASMLSDVTHFLTHLSDVLHEHKKIITLVIPPANVRSVASSKFSKHNFQDLKNSIDYFSMMTYDYHVQAGAAAPISPIEWIEDSIRAVVPADDEAERSKILLGIHFYGMKFGKMHGSVPIIGHEFIQILKTYNPKLAWHAQDAEHSAVYDEKPTGEGMFVFYPSLMFLDARLKLARALGTGVAIWEIGQGLDYFYDLL